MTMLQHTLSMWHAIGLDSNCNGLKWISHGVLSGIIDEGDEPIGQIPSLQPKSVAVSCLLHPAHPALVPWCLPVH